jgi:hypothetical protein
VVVDVAKKEILILIAVIFQVIAFAIATMGTKN